MTCGDISEEDYHEVHMAAAFWKQQNDKKAESISHIREYLDTMSTEPEGYIKLSEVYHALTRMLPDE